MAISATRECGGCISSHARGAARQGATEAEVAEAMSVVIMLNGGPGTVGGPRALAAYRESRLLRASSEASRPTRDSRVPPLLVSRVKRAEGATGRRCQRSLEAHWR